MQTEKQRERLVELLRKSGASFERALPEEIADYLLANGVIVPTLNCGDQKSDCNIVCGWLPEERENDNAT